MPRDFGEAGRVVTERSISTVSFCPLSFLKKVDNPPLGERVYIKKARPKLQTGFCLRPVSSVMRFTSCSPCNRSLRHDHFGLAGLMPHPEMPDRPCREVRAVELRVLGAEKLQLPVDLLSKHPVLIRHSLEYTLHCSMNPPHGLATASQCLVPAPRCFTEPSHCLEHGL